jgi:deoxyribodipyrimidine photo-lyase
LHFLVTALLWLRRDLRVHDHPALEAARAHGGNLLPVFCLDPRLLDGRHRSATRTRFLLECLSELDDALRRKGSALIVRSGHPEDVLVELAHDGEAEQVHITADVGPFARHRDARVRASLADAGVALHEHPGAFVLDDPANPATSTGGPYSAFSPYHRRWLAEPRRAVLGSPRRLPPIPAAIDAGRLPRLQDRRFEAELAHPLTGGERAGRRTLSRFLAGPVERYDSARNDLGADGTSRLSPYLHFGCVSPREIEQRLSAASGPDAFRRQLCWRDFYAQILLHNPRNARSEYQRRYRGSIRWSRSRQNFDAWREGRTGFPLVDAAMRQLRREGWIHNRARLVAGSFLTKDLGIDWRWGERWFMRMLLDGDEANNNGNWQWIASVGVDPEPAARRIFNPARQQRRFDPDGIYVRRYVPELVHVPNEYLAEPWTMPDEVQQQTKCVIGSDYPEPIVDHAVARRAALARFAEAR